MRVLDRLKDHQGCFTAGALLEVIVGRAPHSKAGVGFLAVLDRRLAKLPHCGKPYCSFCGKPQDEVAKIIAGPEVFICNECVALCNEIVADELRTPATEP